MTINHSRRKLLIFGIGLSLTAPRLYAARKAIRIPSVLVETSFITNKQEEKLLGEPVFQEKMARALADGINSYFVNENKNNLLS